MTRWMRMGVIVAVTTWAGAGVSRARADFDAEPTPMAEGAAVQVVVVDMSTPAARAEPGAASMEPSNAGDEDLGTAEHTAWVESIWSTP